MAGELEVCGWQRSDVAYGRMLRVSNATKWLTSGTEPSCHFTTVIDCSDVEVFFVIRIYWRLDVGATLRHMGVELKNSIRNIDTMFYATFTIKHTKTLVTTSDNYY